MTTTRRASAAAAAVTVPGAEQASGGRRSSSRAAGAKSRTVDTKSKARAAKGGAVAAKETNENKAGDTAARGSKRSRAIEKPQALEATGTAQQEPARRGRGRAPKIAAAAEPAAVPPPDEHNAEKEPSAKRPRHAGRPSKVDTAALVAAAVAAAVPVVGVDTLLLAAPSGEAPAAVVAPVDPAAEAAHQLQPQGSFEPPETAAAPVPQAPMVLAPRSPLMASPQRNSPLRAVLTATNAAALPMTTALPGPLAAVGPSASSPRAPLPHSVAVLSDQEAAQIRRLLMPGALAGTLMSCAAASDAAAGAPPATRTESSDSCMAEPAGRTGQFKELYCMVSECCSTGKGSAVYISGLPGTGKTYTVSRLLAALPGLAASPASGNVSFCCATLNCMTLDDAAQLYGRLQNELTRAALAESGKSHGGAHGDLLDEPTPTGAAAAHDSLLATLSKLSVVRSAPNSVAAKAGKGAAKAKASKRGRSAAADGDGPAADEPCLRRRVFVVVLDEVDRLLRRRDGGEELARLFQLPSAPGLSVVLLAVANSLDLTERMMPLLRARGLAPRHMVFTAYSRPQVLAILSAQLAAHPRGRRCFDDAALDMVAKSVSSNSGDLRQALKACRTALDVLAEHNRANPAAGRAGVGIREVHAALQRISSQGNGQPAVVAKIKGLPPQQQLVLLALATAVGSRAAANGADGGGAFQPGGALFTGSRPKFADSVAFREIGNQTAVLGAANPGACFEGPTPSKAGRPGSTLAAATPTATRVRGITGPGSGATPASCGRNGGGPSSRTPASILAGDAGLALGLADVFAQYGVLCRQLDIPAMSESAFRTDALAGLDCDGLLRVMEGRTPAATRLSLRVMVRDVQAALADNVMFKRLMGAKAPAAAGAQVPAGAVGVVRA